MLQCTQLLPFGSLTTPSRYRTGVRLSSTRREEVDGEVESDTEATPRQEVALLGPPLVTWAQRKPPRFRSMRTKALLGYLLAEQRAVSREALVSLLWPESDLATGRAALRRTLHNLRKILPGCWQSDRASVAFTPQKQTWVDIHLLLELEAAQEWHDAAELVQGEFLEGVYLKQNQEFETWLLGERQRWLQRSERVLRRAVAERRQADDVAGALLLARRLLKLMPWHEQMHRQVMLLLAQQGQTSAALKQYETGKQLLQQELGVTFSAETEALYTRIRDPSPFALHNIPAPTAPLVGRAEELALMHGWLEDEDVRLITVAGTGGIGKTRLVLALARKVLAQGAYAFPDGVYLVRLATVDDATQLVSATASALNFPLHGPAGRSPQQGLVDYLTRKRLLLLFDSFEHLLAHVGLVSRLLQAAPGIQIVVTSRVKLRLRGEQLLPLKGLPYDDPPGSGVDRAGSDAARLFMSAARRSRPGFSVNESRDVRHLQRICRLVAGMPLALELAATWANTLPLEAIAQEIAQGLDFLESDVRDLPARHRSMRAVFDTSWQRLLPATQRVFARMSVFRGPFSREAAEAVTGATTKELSRLVNHSLITQTADGLYTLHELLRHYAQEKLAEGAGESESTATRFATYYVDFLEERRDQVFSPAQRTVLAEMNAELDNLRAAWEWTLARGRVKQIARSSAGYFMAHFYHSRFQEAANSAARIAAWAAGSEGAEAELVRAEALHHLSFCQIRLGHIAQARAGALESRQIFSRLQTRPPHSYGSDTRFPLALVALIEGDPVHALELMEQAQVRLEADEDTLNLSFVQYILSSAHQALGQYETAHVHALRASELAERVGHEWFLGYTLLEVGKSAQATGQYAKAKQYFEASIPIRRRFNDRGEAEALDLLAEIALVEEEYDEARRLFQDALEIYRDTSDRGGIAGSSHGLARVALDTEAHEEARRQLQYALSIAAEIQFWPLVLAVLVDAGRLLLETGEYARGIELLALAQSHAAAKDATRGRATNELHRWQDSVDPSLFSRAIARGKEADLKTVLRSLKPTFTSPFSFSKDSHAV